jgi:Flp pilus assembly protein TadG
MTSREIHHRAFDAFRPGTPRRVAGQATVETALILPALVVLLMGMIIAGFTFYAVIQVTNAAREGARAGSLYRITVATRSSGWTLDNEVKSAICNSTANTSALGYLTPANCNSTSFNVNSSDVTTTWVDVDGNGIVSSGDQVVVQVTYRYRIPILSGFVRAFGNPFVIVRRVMMEMQ